MSRIIAALALAALASLSLAAAAPAKGRDRNHDRIPDRWEKRHGLSLKVKQARRDQDRDGLTNLGEYRAKLHPRDPDTDGDGLEDGDENAGRVVSFEGGVLTISLAGGGSLAARVGEDTHVKCVTRDEHEGEDEGKPDGDEPEDGEDPEEEPSDQDGEDSGDDDGDEDEKDDDAGLARLSTGDGGDDYEHCGAAALVVGRRVSEAQLELARGRLYWTRVMLD